MRSQQKESRNAHFDEHPQRDWATAVPPISLSFTRNNWPRPAAGECFCAVRRRELGNDEPMIRWTLNEALRGWEYDTIEAGTVAAALASFEADRPAAVLLDINLPDGSGLDALREIKNRQPQAVVIMITANVLIEDTIAALRGGAYDFIGKPVNLNELQVTIRNGIEAGKLRKEVHSILIESELFGYEKGAFTDAKGRKEGLFEQAEGGTIFLDEIGELEIGLQAKLLRVLEEGAFRRVGGLKDLPLDVRVIAASNRDLKSESEAGKFRLDLYYRLSVIQIDLPPLRERGDDVLSLTDDRGNPRQA